MKPNPILRELGFSDQDRVMIVHADDIGMCQAGVAALDGLVNSGVVSSLATMTVCPWFPAVAGYYRAHPAMDLGLHFTVTSEWDAYRWGPISTRNPASGLLDEEGFFPKQSEPVQQHCKAAAVKAELEAQIRRATAAGIDLTHVDSHMGTVFHPKFLQTYLQAAAKAKLPALWLRVDEAGAKALGVDGLGALAMARLTGQLESRGMPLFDRIFVMPLDNPEERVATAQRAMAELPPGLSYFILHPACDTPELRAIAPDWRCRVADYQAFTGDALRDFVKNSGIHVIGWRPLRELMRRKAGRG
jgi:predicted glycoside hydrolase/deacetylase ChbG (UPF0249 family)